MAVLSVLRAITLLFRNVSNWLRKTVKPLTGEVNYDYVVTMAPVKGWGILAASEQS